MTKDNQNTYIVPDHVYRILKWAGLIACPAVAVFVGALGQAWGMDPGLQNALTVTINAAGVLIGSLLGVSQATSKPADSDGE